MGEATIFGVLHAGPRRRGFGADRAFSRGWAPKPVITRESFLLLRPEFPSRVAHEKLKPGLSTFLKNNTRSQPAWQEIVDFSQSNVPVLDRAFAAPWESYLALMTTFQKSTKIFRRRPPG
jgi:hypothetical protein